MEMDSSVPKVPLFHPINPQTSCAMWEQSPLAWGNQCPSVLWWKNNSDTGEARLSSLISSPGSILSNRHFRSNPFLNPFINKTKNPNGEPQFPQWHSSVSQHPIWTSLSHRTWVPATPPSFSRPLPPNLLAPSSSPSPPFNLAGPQRPLWLSAHSTFWPGFRSAFLFTRLSATSNHYSAHSIA